MVFKERREHSRTKVEWPVSMSTTHGLVDGLIKNISSGGALIQSLELPSPEEAPRLRIEIPEHRHSVVTTATVVRFEVCDGDSFVYELGVRLLEISDKDRLTLNNAILYNIHSGSGKARMTS